jgi:HAD superfamily hydrolase (TIGR01490 family)
MNPAGDYIAFFDVDQTLLQVNSGNILVKRGWQKGMVKTKDIIHALYLSLLFRFRLRDTEEIIGEMAGWVKGLSEESVKQLCEEVFLSSLSHAIRPEIYAEIRFHQERNARIVILSSAIQFVCMPLAKLLAIDDVICTELEVREGVFTGRFTGEPCFGSVKVKRLREYCLEKKCSLENVYYYADSISDFQALDAVGYPVCVNPDKKLAGIANEKHWIIHEWH